MHSVEEYEPIITKSVNKWWTIFPKTLAFTFIYVAKQCNICPLHQNYTDKTCLCLQYRYVF